MGSSTAEQEMSISTSLAVLLITWDVLREMSLNCCHDAAQRIASDYIEKIWSNGWEGC